MILEKKRKFAITQKTFFYVMMLWYFIPLFGWAQNPWDMNQLKKAPTFKWLNQDTAKVRELEFTGPSYRQSAATSVFAYYATPGSISGNLKADKNLPLMVLVHGGGGKAFKEWVTLWAKRGYAAIAMDLAGEGPEGKRLPNSGPDQTDIAKFLTIDSALNTQWVYHSVANVILAHSLALSFKEVDPNRTGITGISWGGYLTSIVTGIDSRFKVAIPVYGCGYIYEPGSYFYEHTLRKMKLSSREKWIKLYDPSQYIAAARMPFLWVDGANDMFYQPDILAKTYDLVKQQSFYRLSPDMPHGHQAGWSPREIGTFADHYLLKGDGLPTFTKVVKRNKEVIFNFSAPYAVTEVKLSFTTDSLNSNKKQWHSASAQIKDHGGTVASPPADATLWLLNLTDNKGNTISSEYQFR